RTRLLRWQHWRNNFLRSNEMSILFGNSVTGESLQLTQADAEVFGQTLDQFKVYVKSQTGRDYDDKELWNALTEVTTPQRLTTEQQKRLETIERQILAKRRQKASFAQKVELAKAYLTAKKELPSSKPVPPPVVRVDMQPVADAIDRLVEAIAERRGKRSIKVKHDDGTESVITEE